MRIAAANKQEIFTRTLSLVVGFTLLMVAAAFIRVPLFFTPVPLTLQTLVLYMSLAVLGRKAGISQGSYIVLGVAGLPIFTNAGAGLLYLTGPTGGYIISFLIISLVFPLFMPKDKSFIKYFVFFSLAAFTVFSFGVSWLIFIHRLSLKAALVAGFYPFIVGEIIKITIASLLFSKFRA